MAQNPDQPPHPNTGTYVSILIVQRSQPLLEISQDILNLARHTLSLAYLDIQEHM
jgi:hypothetical protein